MGKDALDHIADHFGSTSGAWDLFFAADHAVDYAKRVPSLSESARGQLTKVSAAVDGICSALTIPDLISETNSFRRSCIALHSSFQLPSSDPFRVRKIAQAVKAQFLNTVSFVNAAAQSALFFDRSQVVSLSMRQFDVISGIYNGSYLISDGVELIEECAKLKNTAALKEEEKTLAWMRIAKDAASVALSTLALAGIVFGIAWEGIAVVGGVVLAMTTFWFVMKLVCYFYNQIFVNTKSSLIKA